MRRSHDRASARQLQRRVAYFMRTRAFDRDQVATFAAEAGKIGSVYIIGGMLRDLHLIGNKAFYSDVDFVIHGCSATELENFMSRYDSRRNRFGGYKASLPRWSVEMWRLEDTWALQAGHCQIRAIEDVRNATFFDWDSILYDVARSRLILGDDYFTKLRNKIIEVQLPHNPNPLGNAVRALRYACKWNAVLGPRLARHVLRQIVDNSWDRLRAYECSSFVSSLLHQLDGTEVERQLRKYDLYGGAHNLSIIKSASTPELPLASTDQQLAFSFTSADGEIAA